jgi:hypothetical protein
MVKRYVCIPRSFLVTNVCNQGKTLCSPCTFGYNYTDLPTDSGFNTERTQSSARRTVSFNLNKGYLQKARHISTHLKSYLYGHVESNE